MEKTDLNPANNYKQRNSNTLLKILLAFLFLLFLAVVISSFYVKNDSQKFDSYLQKLSEVEYSNRGVSFSSSEDRFDKIFNALVAIEPEEEYGRLVQKELKNYLDYYHDVKKQILFNQRGLKNDDMNSQILKRMKAVSDAINNGIQKYKLQDNFYSIQKFFMVQTQI